MNRIFITVLLLSSLVSTFLFAVDMKKENSDLKNNMQAPTHMKKGDDFRKVKKPDCSMEKPQRDGFKHFSFMRYIHKLNLDDKQASKVKEIFKNTKPKVQAYSEAFKDGKFDKNKYIDISLNKYKNMVEYKAIIIDKIYNILTDKQKNDLKTMIDSDKFEDKKGPKDDKYSNGGR